MFRKLIKILIFTLVAICIITMTSCAIKVSTADELAEALKGEGINYDLKEPVDITKMRHARVNEAIALKGENLSIEIYRIEDERTYEIFLKTVVFLYAVDKKVEGGLPKLPKNTISKKPFVIVIREEPEKGYVKRVVNKILK